MFPVRKELSSYAKDRSGATAIAFALLLVPIIAVVGAATDYYSAKKTQADLQIVIDGATLAGAHALANGEDAETAVRAHMKGAWPENIGQPGYTVEVIDDKDVKVTFPQPVIVKTMIMSIVGKEQMAVKPSAVATIRGFKPADIGLVLDSSDSMFGSIGMVKSEAHRFADKIKDLDEIEGSTWGVHPKDALWMVVTRYNNKKYISGYNMGLWPPNWHTPITEMKPENNSAAGLALYTTMTHMPDRCSLWAKACGGPKASRYMILVSDGDEDDEGSCFASKKCTMANACPGLKANGFTVITIAVPGKLKEGNMRACASDNDHYFYAGNAYQLSETFDKVINLIARPIVRLKE